MYLARPTEDLGIDSILVFVKKSGFALLHGVKIGLNLSPKENVDSQSINYLCLEKQCFRKKKEEKELGVRTHKENKSSRINGLFYDNACMAVARVYGWTSRTSSLSKPPPPPYPFLRLHGWWVRLLSINERATKSFTSPLFDPEKRKVSFVISFS